MNGTLKIQNGIVFIVSFATLYSLFCILAPAAQAAMLYFYPQSLQLSVNEETTIELRINTEGQSMNAITVQGGLNGPAATLRGIEGAESVIPIFVTAPTLLSDVRFELSGGIPGGFSGEAVIARLTVRGTSVGKSTLKAEPASQAYINDENSSPLPLRFVSAEIAVGAKNKDYIELTSPSNPDPNQWYGSTEAQIHWNLEPGVEYSYEVSRDASVVPDNSADRPEGTQQWQGTVRLGNLQSGIYYFAVKKIGSSSVSRYQLKIDTEHPVWEAVKLSKGIAETEGRPFVSFLATDSISGIESYTVQIDGEAPVVAVSPYPLPDSYSVLILRAYDRAGNSIEKAIPGPRRNYEMFIIGGIVLILLIAFGILKRRK